MRCADGGETGRQIVVLVDARVLGVVEAGPPHVPVLQTEAEGMNEMELGTDIRAEPDGVTGVRRDFRLIENQVEHDNAPVHSNDSASTAVAP